LINLLDPGDTLMVSRHAGEYSPLPAAGQYSYTRSFAVPNTLPANRFLLLVTDDLADQPETNENNNLVAVAIELHGPDLVVTDLDWPAGDIADGGEVTVSAKVENVGDGTSGGGFYVRFEVDGAYVGRQLVTDPVGIGGVVWVRQSVTAATGVHTVRAVADEYNAVFELIDDNNAYQEDLPEIAAPDLWISGIVWSPAVVLDGDTVTLTATVENAAADTLRDFVVRFEIDGAYIGRQTVSGGLVSGGSIAVQRNWTARPGDHTVTAIVDEYNVVGELVEDNNFLSDVLPTVLAPDLSITSLTWDPPGIVDTDSVTFTAEIHNAGPGDTLGNYYVRFEVNGQFIGRTEVTGGLAATAGVTADMAWQARPGNHAIRAVVDEYNAISEGNEANNDRSESLPTIPDATPPTITSFTPLQGSKVRQSVNLSATAQDIVGVTSYAFDISSDELTWAPLGGGATGQLSWDTTSLVDGRWYVRVTSGDAVGNLSSLTRTYLVDNAAPPAEVLSADAAEFAVALSWTQSPVPDFAYYRLHRSETSGGPYSPINGAMTLESFTDRDVAVGVTYYYVLTIFDHVGNESAASNEVSAAPQDDSTAPTIHSLSPPAGSRSAESIHLSVSAGDNVAVTDYAFDYSPDGVAWTPIAQGPSATADWDLTGLTSGEYQMRVTVSDARDNSSELIRIYEIDNDPPDVPQNLSITPEEVVLVVAWDPVVTADFHHYELSRSTAGGEFQVIVPATTSTVYIDRNVDSGVTYAYKVSAWDSLGNAGAASDEVSAQPLDDTTPPTVLSMQPAGGAYVRGQVTLSAAAFDGIEVLSVLFESSPAGADVWTTIGTDNSPVQVSASTWRGQQVWDTDPLDEGSYDIRATARDYGSNVDFLARTVIVDRVPPPSPEFTTIVNPRAGGTLELNWGQAGDPALAGYRLYRGETSGGPYTLVATLQGLSYIDRNLTNDVPHCYVVTAFDQAGNESPDSTEASGTPTAECDLAVTEITFEPPSPVWLASASIYATITNAGPAAALANVEFYDGAPAGGILIGTAPVSVSVGGSATASCPWLPDSAGVHTITAVLVDITAVDLDAGNDTADAQIAFTPGRLIHSV
ncbi:hypothetical protein H8E07_13030, partial [bacterium]|nr:hypothetical protein [bacterium]